MAYKGWIGEILLNSKRLTMKLLPFDGFFTPLEKNRIDTATKLIVVLSDGPVVSLILVIGLLLLKFGGICFHSELIALSAIESFIGIALSINFFILILSVIHTHYFYGEVKGSETDGLQIINAIKSHKGLPKSLQ